MQDADERVTLIETASRERLAFSPPLTREQTSSPSYEPTVLAWERGALSLLPRVCQEGGKSPNKNALANKTRLTINSTG